MVDRIEEIKAMTVEELKTMKTEDIANIVNSDKETITCPSESGLIVPKNCTLLCSACAIRGSGGLYNGYYID